MAQAGAVPQAVFGPPPPPPAPQVAAHRLRPDETAALFAAFKSKAAECLDQNPTGQKAFAQVLLKAVDAQGQLLFSGLSVSQVVLQMKSYTGLYKMRFRYATRFYDAT